MISGATGALAVVMISLVEDYGVEYLFATVVLMGILQILAGIFKLGKFIRLVPQSVMLGFVNGLAIVIGLAQIRQFQTMDKMGELHWMTGDMMSFSILLVAVTMFIIWATPKITKIIPGPLTAIIIISAFVIYFDVGVPVVGDLASISGGLPQFHMPIVPFEIETLLIICLDVIFLSCITEIICREPVGNPWNPDSGIPESHWNLGIAGDLLGIACHACKICSRSVKLGKRRKRPQQLRSRIE